MMSFKDYLACDDVNKITDVTDQFHYEDISNEHRDEDSQLVSCGQDDSYNELKYIYNQHLSVYVEEGDITKEQAIKALCEVCHMFDSERRNRDEFYHKLSRLLEVEVPFPGCRGR
ncbi:hypothetical protein GHNINEIG_00198 [Hydrogenovibrio crunogenus]|uniref:Uncharacterized protein n=1 Tax=Hydrogenovibrio crunogenus TaxID=39765 RepID=A0A4V1C8K0_9GAMM|nr:hypothetical protein [Hydrogenovibrio crunogenus]QBZ82174.1 hypothetical protein GHNINEIG_00198 [Hydrogenovibrio crunogenus]